MLSVISISLILVSVFDIKGFFCIQIEAKQRRPLVFKRKKKGGWDLNETLTKQKLPAVSSYLRVLELSVISIQLILVSFLPTN